MGDHVGAAEEERHISVARGPGTAAAVVLESDESDGGGRGGSAHHAGTAGANGDTREGVNEVDNNNLQASLADGQAAVADAAFARLAESWGATANGVWLWCCGHRALVAWCITAFIY